MASGSGGSGDDRGDRRNPRNVKDLLNICIASQSSIRDEEEEEFQPMSQQRREWLQSALTDLTVSHVQRMRECLKTLSEEGTKLEDKLVAFEELIEWCENIDFAIDFHKIGGYSIVKSLLSDESAEIRWHTLELMAALVQNNPCCQEAALKENLLSLMLDILDKDPNPTVKVKALYAVSCLIRDMPDGQRVFSELDGFSVVMRAMQTDVEKMKIKATFMLSSLCNNRPDFKDILCDIGMIDQLVGHLGESHTLAHEYIINALLSVVRDHQRAIEECQREELDLHSKLKERIHFLQNKEQFLEEKAYAEELLTLISTSDTSDVAR